ncbi:acyltransferase [Desulfoluna butyratoxydans]|uniref:Trimeric lpxa-like n=1 Tax=Desulfoluna butyratoxydans TaxID=231438 RepID=A0A4U8YGQ6_9BACT|nr:acyltransferase [Desulfoluna butyratoxydans]VFQ42595.1 trimeric lpxa-like [Desulfoluna butyratoxydans]
MRTLLLYIRNKVRISGCHHVQIDRTARVRRCFISIKGQNNRLIIGKGASVCGTFLEINGNDCSIVIGANCRIGHNSYLSARETGISITVGKNSSFSRNVKIMTSDGHNILQGDRRINPARSIVIGDHVWIADGGVVLKGGSVGDHSIIGMNAMVTRAIGSNKIAVGQPAVEVRDEVSWCEELTHHL